MSKVRQLIQKGVAIPAPESVEIGSDVDMDRISGDGVAIHAGCKIFGQSTLILRDVKIGAEGPVTVKNCQIGPEVQLKAGFFNQAVFLQGSSAGSGAHVREGTILEEEASIAHTAGLKQTILFPFVTLGSLINFCDCLMAGGTSRSDHSEVGSSFIHFNYTPNQDKATPSLIGDVPRGVMLNQPPIFLGGQGGLVGPCRLAFGTVTAAGSIVRKDELRPGRLIFEGLKKSGNIPFTPGRYTGFRRIMENNLIYIGNLLALREWYAHVRALFIQPDFPEPLQAGLMEKVNRGIQERIKRLKKVYLAQHEGENLPEYESRYDQFAVLGAASGDRDRHPALREAFINSLKNALDSDKNYLITIKGLPANVSDAGTFWLDKIVEDFKEAALSVLLDQ